MPAKHTTHNLDALGILCTLQGNRRTDSRLLSRNTVAALGNVVDSSRVHRAAHEHRLPGARHTEVVLAAASQELRLLHPVAPQHAFMICRYKQSSSLIRLRLTSVRGFDVLRWTCVSKCLFDCDRSPKQMNKHGDLKSSDAIQLNCCPCWLPSTQPLSATTHKNTATTRFAHCCAS